jgi:uncharacterized OB-fold protein
LAGEAAEERSAATWVPLRDGILEWDGTTGHLVGGRCPDCGAVYFPAPRVCARCRREGLEALALGGSGRVASYTIVHQSTPGFTVPYALAYADLEEGVRVLGQVEGVPFEALRIGLPVRVVVEPVGLNPQGRPVIGYCLHPAA